MYLRVVHGGESRSVTSKYRIFPEEWDAIGRRLVIPYGRSTRAVELAAIESSMLGDSRRMDIIIRELEQDGPYTIDEIMNRYRMVMTGNTIGTFTEKLAAELDRDGYRRTARAYRTAAARLQKFNGGKDIAPDQITAMLVGDFQAALKAEGRSKNTISFYMRTLRAIYHKAAARGRVARSAENPFGAVFTGVSTARKLAIGRSELEKLSMLDPTTGGSTRGRNSRRGRLPDHLEEALAMFLFCYHARGMSFVDMAKLKKTDLDGETIRYRRHKTRQPIELRVLPTMRRIIDWFEPRTVGSDYIFPVISDPGKDPELQYESGLRLQNKRLATIADRCGISKRFSTHSARHSWATVAKHEGLPLAVISEGLGHNSQRTTEIYLASLERDVLDNAAQVVSEAIIPKNEASRRK